MRDWRSEVFRALGTEKLSPTEREDISRELACYLEDLCDSARCSGSDEVTAIERASAELYEDAKLGSNLRRARQQGNMNNRTRRFWIPATATLLASLAFLVSFHLAGFRSSFTMKGELPLTVFLPWLAVLPFLGAAAAYWSRWQRGGQPVPVARFLSVLKLFASFVAVFIASLLVAVPVCTALGLLAPTAGFFRALTGAILSWVAIPGLALFLGVLPFLHDSSTDRRIALGEVPHA